ncbi:MAG: rhodanese-like domain-containing protein [Holosporales bacterium]|jgi:rhodanese-related sulfurtransferase
MARIIDAATAKTWMDTGQAVLIDVRETAEYKEEHIPGSSHIPLKKCTLTQLPQATGKKMIIHCKGGTRGGQACDALLLENPALELYNLNGGLTAWRAAGLPTIKSNMLPITRQVHIAVGGLVAVFTGLGFFVHPGFHALAGIIGLGLLNAGVTGWCGMMLLLAKMPWNIAVKTQCTLPGR